MIPSNEWSRCSRSTAYMYRVFSPARAAYLHAVHHPDDVQRVLVTNQRNYTKGVGLDRVRLLLGNGSMTSEGEASKRQRAMLHPLFHRRMVAGFACSVAAANDRLIDRRVARAGGERHERQRRRRDEAASRSRSS